ncbi:MAG TPA: glycosyltransferase family 87 protein [Chloroflexota bacterium]|nr:glycosyltransferase family 87 protein [Chloroflexota bacterium]
MTLWRIWYVRWYRVGLALVKLGLLVGGFVGAYLAASYLFSPDIQYKDFRQEYTMARAILAGVDPYQPTYILTEKFAGFGADQPVRAPAYHPPTDGFVFLPFGALDYFTAARVWFCLECAIFLPTIVLLLRVAGVKRGGWSLAGISIMALAWGPFYTELALGQVMLPVLLLLLLSRFALKDGHQWRAGFYLGASLLIKPLLWPVVFLFVVQRRWRAAATSSAVVAAGYAVATVVLGPVRVLSYFTEIGPTGPRLYGDWSTNFSAWTIGWRVFHGTGLETPSSGIRAAPLLASPAAAGLVSAALPAILLVLCLWGVRGSRDLDRSLAVVVCVSLLISPFAWVFDLVVVSFAVAVAVGWLRENRFPPAITVATAIVAAALLPSFTIWEGALLPLLVHPVPADPKAVLPFIAVLPAFIPTLAVALLVLTIWFMRTEKSSASNAPPATGGAAQ